MKVIHELLFKSKLGWYIFGTHLLWLLSLAVDDKLAGERASPSSIFNHNVLQALSHICIVAKQMLHMLWTRPGGGNQGVRTDVPAHFQPNCSFISQYSLTF